MYLSGVNSSINTNSESTSISFKSVSLTSIPLGSVHVMLGIPATTPTVHYTVYVLPATLEPETVISITGSSEGKRNSITLSSLSLSLIKTYDS